MLAGMSKEERQAYRKKLKKAEEKKAKEDAEKKAREEKEAREAEKDGKKKNQVRRKEDPDPDGDALLRTKTPLVEAERLLEPLLRHAADFEDTHLLAFEVFVRKGKLLLALRACNAAVRCSPSSFAARRNVAHLAALVASSSVDASTERQAVRTVLDDGVGALTGGATAMAYAQALVAEARFTLEGALAAEAVKLAGAARRRRRGWRLGGSSERGRRSGGGGGAREGGRRRGRVEGGSRSFPALPGVGGAKATKGCEVRSVRLKPLEPPWYPS